MDNRFLIGMLIVFFLLGVSQMGGEKKKEDSKGQAPVKKEEKSKETGGQVTQLGIMIGGIFDYINKIRDANKDRYVVENIHNAQGGGMAEGHAGPNLLQWVGQWMFLISGIGGLAIVMIIITVSSSSSMKSTYQWYNPNHPATGIAYCNPLGNYAQWQHVDPVTQTITPQHEEYYRCHVIETGAKWEDVVVGNQNYHKIVNPDGSFELFESIYRWTEKP